MLFGHVLALVVIAGGGEAEDRSPPVIVLDFQGSEVSHTPGVGSDPDALTTGFSDCVGTWPPYGDPVREGEIATQVAELFAEFDVVVSDEPPAQGAYMRALIGPFDRCGPGVGYAESSCDRTIGHGIVFAKFGAQSHQSVLQQSSVIAHELGHAYGLAHVDNSDDVMHPTAGDGNKRFLDTCSPSDFGGPGDSCPLVGDCPRGQNSRFGLMSILGPARDPMDDPDDSATEACACHSHAPSDPIAGFASVILLGLRRSRGGLSS